MALAPFSVLGAGRLRTDEEEERREKSGEKGRVMFGPDWKRTPEEVKLSRALEKVAKEIGAKSITAGKHPLFEPRVGTRRSPLPSRHSVRHAKDTLCLSYHRWEED